MLSKGNKVPVVQLKNQNGELIDIGQWIGKQPMVIYFYPKDETPGCTREACDFRDSYDDFAALGAQVFGISGDSVNSHAKFATRLKLNFDLLSDPKRIAEKAFGVPRSLLGLLPGRVTFVIDKEGIIQHTYNSTLNAPQHRREALKALKAMG